MPVAANSETVVSQHSSAEREPLPVAGGSSSKQVMFAIRNAHEHEALRCRKRQGAIPAVVAALLRLARVS